jgi:TFIIF-interacting CTD phosphatase-like protein
LLIQKTQISKQQDTIQQILAQMQKSQTLQADLTNQVLLTNRAEREVALDDLLAFLQTQRAQDQAILRLQLNELAEQVEHAPIQTVAHNGGQ